MDEEVRKLMNHNMNETQDLLKDKQKRTGNSCSRAFEEKKHKSDVERLIGPPYHKDKSSEPTPHSGQHVSDEKTGSGEKNLKSIVQVFMLTNGASSCMKNR